MKLSELQSYLSIFFQLPEQQETLHRKRHSFSQTQILEYHYTCLELELFINGYRGDDELPQPAVMLLQEWLAKRGLRISNTNSAYECDATNPANRLSFCMGMELGQVTGIPLSQLLGAPAFQDKPGLLADYTSGRLVTRFVHPAQNDNAMFAAIIADVNSHQLLTRVAFFNLHGALSDVNKTKLVMSLLNLGDVGRQHIHQQITQFTHLFKMLASLDAPDKLRLLRETNCLNGLLKRIDKKRKAEHIEPLLNLLNQFEKLENKIALIEMISPEILDLYSRYPEIKGLLAEKLMNEELMDLVISDAELEKDEVAPEKVMQAEMQNVSVTASEGERRVISEEEVLEEGVAGILEPPKKRIRLSNQEDQDSVVAPVPVPVSAPAPANPVTGGDQVASLVSTSVQTLFNPSKDEKIFYEFYKKAEDCKNGKMPLEALHYAERAYTALGRVGFSLKKRIIEINNLKKLTQESLAVLTGNWRSCFYHYEMSVETGKLLDWCGAARRIAGELLPGPGNVKLLSDLDEQIATFKRYHPEYPLR